MYLIKSGEYTIYDSRDKNTYPVLKPNLKDGLNEAGTLSFTIFREHPHYDKMRKMQTFVTAYRDDEELFYGRILSTEKGLDDRLAVTCEGGLTFFLDSEMDKGEYTETISAFFTRCITNHNSMVEEAKQFEVGMITAEKALDTEKTYNFNVSSYMSTKNALETLITGRFGGYLRVRPNPNGKHFIDYIENYGRENTQPIRIAYNIIDKNDRVSGENIFTVLRPIGKSQPTGESGENTDIMIDGSTQQSTLPNVSIVGNFMYLNDKIEQYGRIVRTEQFSSATTKEDLLEKAEEFIKRRGTQLPANCEINFVDFYHLNRNVMDVRIGDTFTNIQDFSGETMTVGSISLDMEDPANDSITLKNMEEINANRLDYNLDNPAGSSGRSSSNSLSSKTAKSSSQEAFRYKYIREEENKLILATKEIQVSAENRFSVLANKTLITAEEVQGEPGKIQLRAVKKIGTTNPEDPLDDGSEVVVTVDGIRLTTQGKTEFNETAAASITTVINDATGSEIHIAANKVFLEGNTVADAISALEGYFENLFFGTGNTHSLYGDAISANTMYATNQLSVGSNHPGFGGVLYVNGQAIRGFSTVNAVTSVDFVNKTVVTTPVAILT